MDATTKRALSSKAHDVDDFAAAQEFYHSNGWTDGLPVVPPTEKAVEACLEWAMMPPDFLIGIEPVREQPITAEKLAINAVMAGCLPMHFPHRRHRLAGDDERGSDDLGVADVVWRQKTNYSAPADAHIVDEARQWHVAATGIGD